MILRPYQRACSDAVIEHWQTAAAALAVIPTGGGKTIVFADLIRRMFPLRAMVIAHRQELIFQARNKIRAVTDLPVELEMGEYHVNATADFFSTPAVVVSSIQTQNAGADGSGRKSKFNPHEFGLLIIDEAHHATAASYRRVINYYRQNPQLKVLGVTATPDRADQESLGQIFDGVAFNYLIEDAIRDGWLVGITQRFVSVAGLDYSQVRTVAGDLNGADLAKVLEQEEILHKMATPTVAIAGNRRTIVFTETVRQAERFAEILNRHRPHSAAWVCGKTPDDRRQQTLQEFASGKIQFVVNVGVLTEGFDDPGVEVIVMGRPTKSRALYAQMCGRSMRPLPGLVDGPANAAARKAAIAASSKPVCEIVDFVGNSGRHKLISSADILGGRHSDAAIAAVLRRAKGSTQPVRMDELLVEEERRLEEERRAAEAARRARLTVGVQWNSKSVNPFDVLAMSPARERSWQVGLSLSDKQRAILSKNGIDPDSVDYAQGRQLVTEIFRRWQQKLCSYKQAKLLRRYGYDTTAMSYETARATLDSLSKNGWQKTG